VRPAPAYLLAGLLGGGVIGCMQPVSLAVDPTPSGQLASTGRSLRVDEPVDLRPVQEREGRTPELRAWVPLLVHEYQAVRGQWVSGDSYYDEQAWNQLHTSLLGAVESSALFVQVTNNGAADYVLESEVLHLTCASYSAQTTHYVLVYVVVVAGYVPIPVVDRVFLPQATAVLRLRLRDAQGTVVGERVVRGAVVGGLPTRPDPWTGASVNPSQLTREALRAALHNARSQVSSWIMAHEARERSPARARADLQGLHTAGHTFLVQAVDWDRRGTTFAELACPSGQELRRFHVEGVPVVGDPGEWLVSPMDEGGVKLPLVDYDALTRHLDQEGFALQRAGHIAAYRYLGRQP
jgi:hypothetical protein